MKLGRLSVILLSARMMYIGSVYWALNRRVGPYGLVKDTLSVSMAISVRKLLDSSTFFWL